MLYLLMAFATPSDLETSAV